ncbi:MAG: MBL fold metallo-hydrolase [Pirellulaceae bacterium]
MKLVHHGGHLGVTGSCHQLWTDDRRSLLVDCGTFQGDDAREHPNPEVKFSLRGIECLLLTHVHIDHCGRIPYLLAAGFDQPIYCSRPTAKLLPLVMQDALKIGFTRNQRLIDKFHHKMQALLQPLSYHQWHPIQGGSRLRLRPAGHVLGSAIFEIETAGGERAVFSGDLGPRYAPLLHEFTSPERADLLVMESTYGDRIHEDRRNRQARLEQVLRHSLSNLGVTIIPAFSLGRTQDILFEMNAIFERIQKQEGRSLMKQVDVIVDSPLASRFTEIYDDMQEYWSEEARQVLKVDDQPLVFENLTTIGDHQEHVSTLDYLVQHNLPAVVVAGSGMCTGGRVMNYLRRLIGDSTTDIVFCGYQASGTPGSYIQRGSEWVRLDGRKYPIHAAVHQLSGYSAHADQEDLLRFVREFQEPPKKIRLVHGEYQVRQTLAAELRQRGYDVD